MSELLKFLVGEMEKLEKREVTAEDVERIKRLFNVWVNDILKVKKMSIEDEIKRF